VESERDPPCATAEVQGVEGVEKLRRVIPTVCARGENRIWARVFEYGDLERRSSHWGLAHVVHIGRLHFHRFLEHAAGNNAVNQRCGFAVWKRDWWCWFEQVPLSSFAASIFLFGRRWRGHRSVLIRVLILVGDSGIKSRLAFMAGALWLRGRLAGVREWGIAHEHMSGRAHGTSGHCCDTRVGLLKRE